MGSCADFSISSTILFFFFPRICLPSCSIRLFLILLLQLRVFRFRFVFGMPYHVLRLDAGGVNQISPRVPPRQTRGSICVVTTLSREHFSTHIEITVRSWIHVQSSPPTLPLDLPIVSVRVLEQAEGYLELKKPGAMSHCKEECETIAKVPFRGGYTDRVVPFYCRGCNWGNGTRRMLSYSRYSLAHTIFCLR